MVWISVACISVVSAAGFGRLSACGIVGPLAVSVVGLSRVFAGWGLDKLDAGSAKLVVWSA